MSLKIFLFCIFTLSLNSYASTDKSNDYHRFVVSSLSPDKVLKPLNLVERDVGFGINVHAKKGEIATKIILGSTTKRIRTAEFSLFYFNIESNQGITTFGDDGYTMLLEIIGKIKQDRNVKFEEPSRALLQSYFDPCKTGVIELFVADDNRYVLSACDGDYQRLNVTYKTDNPAIVIMANLDFQPDSDNQVLKR